MELKESFNPLAFLKKQVVFLLLQFNECLHDDCQHQVKQKVGPKDDERHAEDDWHEVKFATTVDEIVHDQGPAVHGYDLKYGVDRREYVLE